MPHPEAVTWHPQLRDSTFLNPVTPTEWSHDLLLTVQTVERRDRTLANLLIPTGQIKPHTHHGRGGTRIGRDTGTACGGFAAQWEADRGSDDDPIVTWATPDGSCFAGLWPVLLPPCLWFCSPTIWETGRKQINNRLLSVFLKNKANTSDWWQICLYFWPLYRFQLNDTLMISAYNNIRHQLKTGKP